MFMQCAAGGARQLVAHLIFAGVNYTALRISYLLSPDCEMFREGYKQFRVWLDQELMNPQLGKTRTFRSNNAFRSL